jgi:hypothetical protein
MTYSKKNLNNGQNSLNEQLYHTLLNETDYLNLDNDAFLDQISKLIDLSFYRKNQEGFDLAISQFNHFFRRNLSDIEKGISYYFLANAISDKVGLKIKQNDVLLKWENPEIEKEILFYRLALKYLQLAMEKDAFPHNKSENEKYHCKNRYCQICTNLGNLMDNIGRFVEAIEFRNCALAVDPNFGMALGSKGLSYSWYAPYLYDRGHQAIFGHTSYHLLKKALTCELEHGASESYHQAISYLQSKLPTVYLEKDLDLQSFSFGKTREEKKYRTWCLDNYLFLNPLNDIGSYPVAASDVLSIPTIVTDIKEGPNSQILFNQLKQEFVTARYLYYQGISRKTVHFSDKDVLLFDTEDFPVYSKSAEEMKMSFRICYSILDKIAFFLNYYFNLDINERDINFKTIWYTPQKSKNNKRTKGSKKSELHIRRNFSEKNNLPLLGLFWISKDLFTKNILFREALEPEAKEWYEIRNHLEHKFLRLQLINHEIPLNTSSFFGKVNKSLVYSLEVHDFERKTLKLIKTVRASLIYLVLAMRYEEYDREKKREGPRRSIQIGLKKFPDKLKINNYRL